jgi:predicted 2-oxoglutarate/Fe(II)-dependent dioxygenase YbiX
MQNLRVAVQAVYRDPAFLVPDSCERIRRAMDAGIAESAEVLEGQIERRDAVRLAASIEIDDLVRADVETRLDAVREAIATFHGVQLGPREGAGFIRYPDGGFYRSHRDRASVASWPEAARRRIAVVVFLNSSKEGGADGFAGGILRLFVDASAIEIPPSAGLLVAFPADALHEVTAVRGGTRDAVVDWFYGN